MSTFALRAGVDDEIHEEIQRTTGFWGAQGAGCIVICPPTRRMLLGLRGPNGPEPHTWGGWGGALDKGEDPKSGAKRELWEESGYVGPCRIEPLFVYRKQDFQFTNFLCLVPKEFSPVLSEETSDAGWFNWNELPSPYHYGLVAILQDVNAFTSLMRYMK